MPKLKEAEALQIALGFISAGKNGGFLQNYILNRELNNGRRITSGETEAKAEEVQGLLDDLMRKAQREQR